MLTRAEREAPNSRSGLRAVGRSAYLFPAARSKVPTTSCGAFAARRLMAADRAWQRAAAVGTGLVRLRRRPRRHSYSVPVCPQLEAFASTHFEPSSYALAPPNGTLRSADERLKVSCPSRMRFGTSASQATFGESRMVATWSAPRACQLQCLVRQACRGRLVSRSTWA